MKKRAAFFWAIIACAVLLACPAPAWQTEVAATGNAAAVALAVDAADAVHMSFYDESTGDLRYATNASGSWSVETVDHMGEWALSINLPPLTDIVVDGAGHAFISYVEWSTVEPLYSHLKVATNAGGSWTTEVVGNGTLGGTSIVLDGAGALHVSFAWWDPATFDLALGYATNGSGGWVIETMDPGSIVGMVGFDTDLALDSAGSAHISYGLWFHDLYTESYLKYATNASGSWVTATIDGGPNEFYTGWFNAVVVDGSDHVHIAYSRDGNRLGHATNASGSWSTADIGPAGFGGVGLTLDPSGVLYASAPAVYDVGTPPAGVLCATNAEGYWLKVQASSNPLGAEPCTSIVLDAAGQVRIGHNGDDGSLLLTTGIPEPPRPGKPRPSWDARVRPAPGAGTRSWRCSSHWPRRCCGRPEHPVRPEVLRMGPPGWRAHSIIKNIVRRFIKISLASSRAFGL